MQRRLLGFIPIVVDRAEKETSDVMVDTTLVFPFCREVRSVGGGWRTAIEPLGDCTVESAGIVAACIVCTRLQLKLLLGWQKVLRNV